MKRQKDKTPVKCKICSEVVVASGMPSHLYHKHDKMSSDEYAKKYGEFRQKYLKKLQRKEESEVECKICNKKMVSHKALLHHLHKHNIHWEEYFVKYYFNGEHPRCGCGCGEEVKLLRHGKNEKGITQYAREFIAGHNTRLRKVGYRTNSLEQRHKMRKSAIKRQKQGNGVWHTSGPSKTERELHNFIKSLNIEYEPNNKELLNGLEIDILIPDNKIGIEFNGSYFHREEEKGKKYHLKKTQECNQLGYKLLHIWEPDWYLNKQICKSILKNTLGKTQYRIYGRRTEIKEISNKQAVEFLTTNHLQGPSVSKVRLGLFFKDELVSVMTFSSLRKATGNISKENCYELVRFCNKLDTTVVGGASKLFKYFVKTYRPEYILSYANRDWSVGNMYEHLGMNFLGYTPPGYFYVKSKHKFSRNQFQKHKLVQQGADPSMTEYEIMKQKGYLRIWDTGNLKYEWKQ